MEKNMPNTSNNIPTTSHKFDSSPNPGKLIQSLRHLGYDNYSAIADIVDNSFDADAQEVKIIVRKKDKEIEIFIADNGDGMSEEILGQAIRLGSDTPKNAESDLGKFGMGLCTATLSICRQTTVLTKSRDNELLKAVNDVDEVIRSSAFISFLGPPDATDIALFNEFLGSTEHGTIICLKNCDNLANSSNTTILSNKIKKELAQTFRYFLKSGRRIYVNGDQLKPFDPIEWDDEKTEKYDDGFIDIEFELPNKMRSTERVSVKIAIVKDNSERGENELNNSQLSQGFYIMRNNREILAAASLGFFTKHNSFNRLRGEISFSGNLDQLFGINFTKKNIVLTQSLEDKLKNYLGPQITSIKNKQGQQNRKEAPENIKEIHQDASKEINRKAKLLIRPKALIEKRATSNKITEKNPPRVPSTLTREPAENTQTGFAANASFETSSMGISGEMYEAQQRGRTTVVTYNSDHPFYQRFILNYGNSDRALVAGIDYLIYSLATAELSLNLEEDDVRILVNNFKGTVSSNLRTLLS